jgi:hypothetical protein
MTKNKEIKWMKIPENHDYDAAFSYLKLLYDEEKAKSLVQELKNAPMTKFKAKDIFRASKESPLGIDLSFKDSINSLNFFILILTYLFCSF